MTEQQGTIDKILKSLNETEEDDKINNILEEIFESDLKVDEIKVLFLIP
jgi:hypothetical protein